MNHRIAIPIPTAEDSAYNQRTLPLYSAALRSVGLEPETIALDLAPEQMQQALERCAGVLLPGSRFDVNPARYGEPRHPECGPSDARRTVVDEALLADAFSRKKPVLTICHGTQSLNAWLGGKLTQDLQTVVDHRPGRAIVEAHPVEIAPGSRLSDLLAPETSLQAMVNSTHHQAICLPGAGLRIAAVSPEDGVIEAVEVPREEHFVVAVQWHPERTLAESSLSRALFTAFKAAVDAYARREEVR